MTASELDAAEAPATLARAFHEDGFVALDRARFGLSDSQVARVLAAVQARYEQLLGVAETNAIDLAQVANAERIPGFYVRQGGRVDMELVSVVARANANLPDARAAAQSLVRDVPPVDAELFRALETSWKSVVDAVFSADSGSSLSSQHALEYIGCVVARPGDGDQNWHLDGVHRDRTKHEPADRINVFVPLVRITPEIGGTEMKRRSQFHDEGRRGVAFEGYAELESVTHFVEAGTPVVMDYRVWHRGRANGSATTLRPLLYFKYARKEDEEATVRIAKSAKRNGDAQEEVGATAPQKKKKRVALMTVVRPDEKEHS